MDTIMLLIVNPINNKTNTQRYTNFLTFAPFSGRLPILTYVKFWGIAFEKGGFRGI